MLKSAIRIAAVLAVSAAAAAVYVQARGLRWTPDAAKVDQEKQNRDALDAGAERIKEIHATRSITIDQLREHIAMESIFVDARTAELFAAGHLRAPIIINIFGDDARQPANIERLSPNVAAGRPIVIYCNSTDCDLSDLLYLALEDTYGPGALDMYIYVPGWAGIEAAGLETTTDPETDLTGAGGMADDLPGEDAPAADEPEPASADPGGG